MFRNTYDNWKSSRPESPLAENYGASVNNAINTAKNAVQNASEDWSTFINKKFDYKIEYPSSVFVGCGKSGVSTEESSEVCFYIWQSPNEKGEAPTMYVSVKDSDFGSSKYKETLDLSLKDYADEIWQMNRDERSSNKKVSSLDKIKIAGRTGYKFTVTGSYRDETGTDKLNEEATVIFFSDKYDIKFAIVYPTARSVFTDMLDTLTLI